MRLVNGKLVADEVKPEQIAAKNIGGISDIYSSESKDALASLTEIENNKPGEYQSQYASQINSALNNILNRKDFSYDFNADPLYQQYKDSYTQQGNQAMMNTVANAATMTGGYGNSYGVTAGVQANQMYLQELNNVIPELYNAALQKYDMDTQNLYNQYSALGSQEDREYNKYRDTVSDWQTDRGYYSDKYNTAVSNDQYVANYNQAENQYTTNYNQAERQYASNYNQAENQYVSSYNQTEAQNQREYEMWLAEMQYQKERDAVADSQWQQQWDYQLQQAALAAAAQQASSSGSSPTSSNSSSSGSTSSSNSTSFQSAMREARELQWDGGDYEEYLVDKVSNGEISQDTANRIYATLNNYK